MYNYVSKFEPVPRGKERIIKGNVIKKEADRYIIQFENNEIGYCLFYKITDLKYLKPDLLLKVGNEYHFWLIGIDKDVSQYILSFKKVNPMHTRNYRSIAHTPSKHKKLLDKMDEWIKNYNP